MSKLSPEEAAKEVPQMEIRHHANLAERFVNYMYFEGTSLLLKGI
jgi:hypothetical protein